MVMRIGGLASGMDIDSIIEKLMNAERTPLNKLQQKKQTYEWQRDAYRDVNKKLKTFDTYIADNLVLKTLNSKTATSSNSNLVSATATGSATGTLSIEGVSQLATNARAVGKQVSATSSTKMSDFAGTGTIELKAIQKDGTMAATATKIEITSDMTVSQFVSKVNSSNAGVNAVFENGRFSFTAKNSGDNKTGDEIEISEDSKQLFHALGFFGGPEEPFDATKAFQTTEGKNAIFQVNGIATERSSNTFTISGYNITLKETFNGKKTFLDKYNAAETELTNAKDNQTAKQKALGDAKDVYYSPGATSTPNYTDAHNAAYTAAFGNTLNISQQETYAKLTRSQWQSLESDEMNFLAARSSKSVAEIIADIENADDNILSDDSKEKLKALGEKLEDLTTVSAGDFTAIKEQAEYATYGVGFKALDGLYDDLMDLDLSDPEAKNAAIEDLDFGANVTAEQATAAKDYLKKLSIADLTNLKSMDETEFDTYTAKAQADDLKVKFNSLGSTLISELGASSPNPSNASPDQLDTWTNLTDEQKKNFKALAAQNLARSTYKAAETEKAAADARVTKATEDEASAKIDAMAEGVIDSAGKPLDGADSALVNAPTTAPVTMTSTTNVDEMMTKIKEFVATYNGLIKDFTDQTKQSKYRDYQPLTAEQRKEMDEDEIKLWEEKAKSGLLRNDSLIRDGISNMRALVYQSNPGLADSKFQTLFSVGITTSKNYNDGGTLEIDENKLRKALEEDPDAVERLFKNPSGKKSDTIQVMENGVEVTKKVDTRGYLEKLREAMKSFEINVDKKAGRSTMTDAQFAIGKSLLDTEKRITSWQDKLKMIEDRYWKQFTAMESAINKANQQSSMFMQG